MTSGESQDELRAHLRNRIPEPGPGYWNSIDERLRAITGDAGHEEPADTDVTVVRPTDMDNDNTADDDDTAAISEAPEELPWWREGRVLAAAAGILLVLGLGALALSNRSSDDPLDLATASEQAADGAAADAGSDVAAGADGSAAAANTGLPNVGPLSALQAGLAGENAPNAGSAGPFCFASNDAYVFPADELTDRRALVWMEIASDGFVDFYALQGDLILIAGSGLASSDGVLITSPTPIAGATGGLPPFTISITDGGVQFTPEGEVMSLVSCATVQDRVDQLFALLDGPGFVDNGVNWPPADAVLSSAGLGPMRVGMTVAELSGQLATELRIETIDIATAGECGWIADSDAISNAVWTLVELTSATDGIIRRITVTDPRWSTPSGGAVGMTAQQIREIFPNQIDSSPHVYVEGEYLTYIPASDADPNTVQFVSEGGTIAQIHVGDRTWVPFVEGCA